MKNLIYKALNLAQLKGAEYADIRIVSKKRESIDVKSRVLWNAINTKMGVSIDEAMIVDPINLKPMYLPSVIIFSFATK